MYLISAAGQCHWCYPTLCLCVVLCVYVCVDFLYVWMFGHFGVIVFKGLYCLF